MKKVLAILALALLASCTKQVPRTQLVVPSWACTQTPTGLSRTNTRSVYCGRACSRQEEYKEYSIKVTCEYYEWREE